MRLLRVFAGATVAVLAIPTITAVPATPAAAQEQFRAQWGVLAEIAERDLEVNSAPVTVRWTVPNRTLVVTGWYLIGQRGVEFDRNPATGIIRVRYPHMIGREYVGADFSVAADGSILQNGKSRFVWKEADAVVIRNFGPLRPITKPKVSAAIAKQIAAGKARPANPQMTGPTPMAAAARPPEASAPARSGLQGASGAPIASSARIGAPVNNLPGAVWADANNDGHVDGYVHNGAFVRGAPKGGASASAPLRNSTVQQAAAPGPDTLAASTMQRWVQECRARSMTEEDIKAKWGPLTQLVDKTWEYGQMAWGILYEWVDPGCVMRAKDIATESEYNAVTFYTLMPDGTIESRYHSRSDGKTYRSSMKLEADGSFTQLTMSKKTYRNVYLFEPPDALVVESYSAGGQLISSTKFVAVTAAQLARHQADFRAAEAAYKRRRDEERAREWAEIEAEERAWEESVRAQSAPVQNPLQVFAETFASEMAKNNHAQQAIVDQYNDRIASTSRSSGSSGSSSYDSTDSDNDSSGGSGNDSGGSSAPSPTPARPAKTRYVWCVFFAHQDGVIYSSRIGSYSDDNRGAAADRATPGWRAHLRSMGLDDRGGCYTEDTAAEMETYQRSYSRLNGDPRWTDVNYTPSVPGH